MSLIQMSFAGAIIIAAVVIIRALFMYKLPKKTFLVLWVVAVLRLLIPIALPAQTSIFTIWENINLPFSGLSTTYEASNLQFPPPVLNARNWQASTHAPVLSELQTQYIFYESSISNFTMESLLITVWLAGVFISALLFIGLYIKWRRVFMMSLPVEKEFVSTWLQKHKLKRQIQVRVSDRITAPLTYGILSPVILMPKNTNWKDEERIEYILTHEFVHIKGFDTLAKFIIAAVLCVHWFNPLVWAMYVLFNRDMEISCDESVIKMLGEDSKSNYAMTLITIQECGFSAFTLHNAFSRYAIEERVNALVKTKRISFAGVLLAIILVVSTTAVFATAGVSTHGTQSSNNSFPYFNINVLTDYPIYGTVGAEEAVEIAISEFARLFAGWSEDWEHWREVAFNMSFADKVLESGISSIRQDNPQVIPIWSGFISADARSPYEVPAFSFIINAETGGLVVVSYAPITQRFDRISEIDDLFGSMFDSPITSVGALEENDTSRSIFNFQVTYASGEQATFSFIPMDEEWTAVMHIVIEFLD